MAVGSEQLSVSNQDITDLVDEIRRLISLVDCGIRIDWEGKDFIYFYLFQIWRECEKEIRNQREFNLQQFIKNFSLV